MSPVDGEVVMTEFLITTTDNPFNPFTHWDEWYAFDVRAGYNTCSYIARLATPSPSTSQPDQDLAIDLAMEEVLQYNVTGNYVRVLKDSSENSVSHSDSESEIDVEEIEDSGTS